MTSSSFYPHQRTPDLPSVTLDDFDPDSPTSEDTIRLPHLSSTGSPRLPPPSPRTTFLFLPNSPGQQSTTSTANSTPNVSRPGSPLPQFFTPFNASSCSSETESEDNSPLLSRRLTSGTWRTQDRRWWEFTQQRRRRDGRWWRILKKWTRRIFRHPLVPKQPLTIILTLLLLSGFATSLTFLLMYIFNPDKEPLPWRGYCSIPSMASPADYTMSSSYPFPYPGRVPTESQFPPPDLDSLPPAGVFIGVFSVDSAFERRSIIRSTWASHERSRNGNGAGDGGVGTSRSVVRFVVGQPSKHLETQIQLEMELYHDIVILPMAENMNNGKSYAFFSWASLNAWIPPIYADSVIPPPRFSYSNLTTPPPPLAPHDPIQAWADRETARPRSWVRPDYVVKVDDDSFVMIAELEARLRVALHQKMSASDGETPGEELNSTMSMSQLHRYHEPSGTDPLQDPMIYWGYLVTNRAHRFMAGELYALSWNLVDWVARDPAVKAMVRGAEDKQTAKWMTSHPRAPEIQWTSERCWIYDHPRAGTVYAHGFLFPSEVARVRRAVAAYIEAQPEEKSNAAIAPETSGYIPAPGTWAQSSVSTFGTRYSSPLPGLSTPYGIEAMVEGSNMSQLSMHGLQTVILQDGIANPMTTDYAWKHREGRAKRYEHQRVGGTIVVHFIKKNAWYLETALALLDGDDYSDAERLVDQKLYGHDSQVARTRLRRQYGQPTP